MLTRENLKTHWWYRLIKVCFITSLFFLLILVVITAYGERPVAVPSPYYSEPSPMSQSGNLTPAMSAAFDKAMGVQTPNPIIPLQQLPSSAGNNQTVPLSSSPMPSLTATPPVAPVVPYDYQRAISDGANPSDVVNYLAQQTGYNAYAALKDGANVNDVLAYMSKLPYSGSTQSTQTTNMPTPISQPQNYSGSWWNVVLWLIGGIAVVALIGWVAKTIFFYVFIGEKPSIF